MNRMDKMEGGSVLESSVFSSAQFSQIVFHNLSDSYPTDSNLLCKYSVNGDIVHSEGDRIGVFQVGWQSIDEAFFLQQAPKPTNAVIFKAEDLPKDDKMYQLCYITKEDMVAGASIPFFFRSPLENELMAVEDVDNDFVTVHSNFAVVQLANTDLTVQNQKLKDELERISKELSEAKMKNAEAECSKVEQDRQQRDVEIQTREKQDFNLFDPPEPEFWPEFRPFDRSRIFASDRKPCPLDRSCYTEVTITCVVDHNTYYAQPSTKNPEMHSYFFQVLEAVKSAPALKECAVGTLCFAAYCGDWYRGRIEAVSPKFLVYLIDYGSIVECGPRDLREISEEFRRRPEYIFKLQLAENASTCNLNRAVYSKLKVKPLRYSMEKDCWIVVVEGDEIPWWQTAGVATTARSSVRERRKVALRKRCPSWREHESNCFEPRLWHSRMRKREALRLAHPAEDSPDEQEAGESRSRRSSEQMKKEIAGLQAYIAELEKKNGVEKRLNPVASDQVDHIVHVLSDELAKVELENKKLKETVEELKKQSRKSDANEISESDADDIVYVLSDELTRVETENKSLKETVEGLKKQMSTESSTEKSDEWIKVESETKSCKVSDSVVFAGSLESECKIDRILRDDYINEFIRSKQEVSESQDIKDVEVSDEIVQVEPEKLKRESDVDRVTLDDLFNEYVRECKTKAVSQENSENIHAKSQEANKSDDYTLESKIPEIENSKSSNKNADVSCVRNNSQDKMEEKVNESSARVDFDKFLETESHGPVEYGSERVKKSDNSFDGFNLGAKHVKARDETPIEQYFGVGEKSDSEIELHEVLSNVLNSRVSTHQNLLAGEVSVEIHCNQISDSTAKVETHNKQYLDVKERSENIVKNASICRIPEVFKNCAQDYFKDSQTSWRTRSLISGFPHAVTPLNVILGQPVVENTMFKLQIKTLSVFRSFTVEFTNNHSRIVLQLKASVFPEYAFILNSLDENWGLEERHQFLLEPNSVYDLCFVVNRDHFEFNVSEPLSSRNATIKYPHRMPAGEIRYIHINGDVIVNGASVVEAENACCHEMRERLHAAFTEYTSLSYRHAALKAKVKRSAEKKDKLSAARRLRAYCPPSIWQESTSRYFDNGSSESDSEEMWRPY